MQTPKDSKSKVAETREARLAQALRANLRRRKSGEEPPPAPKAMSSKDS